VWVPLNITGKSVGISTGGKLRQPYREVRVKTTPDKIPSEITVDITSLDLNDAIMASNLNLGDGVKVVYDRDFVIAKILAPKGKDAEK
jgi:large subunit ribosomal protein L25